MKPSTSSIIGGCIMAALLLSPIIGLVVWIIRHPALERALWGTL